MKLIEDVGMQYPKLNSKTKRHFAIYECSECKKHIKIRTDKTPKYGTCNSCAHKKSSKTHGYSNHPLYHTWIQEHKRCKNKNNISYKYYGAKGIKISEEFNDIKTWIVYVESLPNAYKNNYTIDRINTYKDYKRGNLRWASKTTQARNTRLIQSNNKTGYRGVHFSKETMKYRSTIQVDKKCISLGFFKDKLKAAIAYDSYVIKNNLEHTINGVLYSNIKEK